MSRPWSTKSGAALSLEIRPSRALAVFLITVVALALWAVAGYPFPLAVRWGLGVGLIVAVYLEAAKHFGLPPFRRVVGLRWAADGNWLLRMRGGRAVDATLLSAYAQVGLVVLRFRIQDRGVRTLVLPWDSIDGEDARRLRVRLRISGLCR